MKDCILCKIGELDRDGYRRLHLNRQRIRAHRFVWMLCNGEIPDGMLVLHSCDNPPCINPAHLRLGTNIENVRDRTERGRQPRGEKAYQARITEKQAKAIIAALRADESQTRIAQQFGINKWLVHDIKRGKTWKHLPR